VDALRTLVRRVQGRPEVEIVGHLDASSRFVDLSGHPDPDAAPDQWARAEVDRVLDLSVRSFESTLLELAPRRTAWALLQHHLFSDASSVALLYRRVGDRYAQLAARDGAPALAPAADAPSYAAYVRHELEQEQTERFRKREAYWHAKLSDPPEPLVFYGGRSASAGLGVRRERIDRRLGPELTEAVRELAGRDGVRFLSEQFSVFGVFCAALIACLHRLGGQERIAIGVPWLNRPRAFHETCGLFMEQDPFVVTVSSDDTFESLLRKIHAEARAVMAHLPYSAGNPGGRIYDVSLNYFTLSLGPFAGLAAEPRWYRPSYGHGSMQVQVHDLTPDRELTLSVDFDTATFTPADRESAIAHYLGCLSALLADPTQRIGAFDLLTDAERTLLAQWNDTRRDHPREQTVVDLVTAQAERRPDAVALTCGGQRISYGELQRRAHDLAQRLRAAGVGPGVLVGVYLNRSVDLVVGLLGVLEAGGAYVPLDPAFPRDRLAYMLDDSQAPVLLSETSLLGTLAAEGRTVLCVDAAADAAPAPARAARPGPDDLAYVLYTSGSTGRPKGVEIPHRALTNFLCSMRSEPGCSEADHLLAITTLSFDIAGLELFLPLITGGRVEIASRETAIDGRLLRKQLESGAFTILQATPATWRILLDAGWTGSPNLKALIGGEALPPELVAPLLARTASLWNLYGPTETTIWSSLQRVTTADEITVGRPIANTSFLVVDSRLQPVPIGVAGELLIGGEGLARGYHRRPELTAERFVAVSVPGATTPERMYRTGDLVRLRRDGQLVHLGRLDHQVKIRGFRIELGEIEALLIAHEAIQQAVVVARDAGTAAARLVAYYVPATAEPPPPAELRRHLRASLPEYMVPPQYVALAEFPLTPNGKIDRLRLPEPAAPDDAASEQLAPRTAAEARVAAAFCDVLGLPAVGVDADFFDLGGQSILGLQLVTRLEEEFGVEVPLQVLFEASSVAALAARVSSASADGSQPARHDRAELVRRLGEVWGAALGAVPDDPHDRAAGAALGDADVTRLLAELRRAFGVVAEGVSGVEFRKDPSVAGLARLIEDAMEPPPRLLVPLQRRGSGRPLFLIHAGGGYVFFYRALAAHLGDSRPVYGIRAATRHDGESNRFDRATSVEEIAARYIEEIEAVQPAGPYHLGGACFGGVLAFEIARQLRARGQSLASPLLLFDAYATSPQGTAEWRGYRHWVLSRAAEKLGAGEDLADADDALRRILRSVARRPGALARLPLLGVRAVLRRLARRVRDTGWARRLRERRRRSKPREQQQLDTMAELLDASLRLLAGYRPAPLPDAATLFRAEKSPDPEPEWLPLLQGGVRTHVLPGEHLDMLEEPWVVRTAALVAASLDAGFDAPVGGDSAASPPPLPAGADRDPR